MADRRCGRCGGSVRGPRAELCGACAKELMREDLRAAFSRARRTRGDFPPIEDPPLRCRSCANGGGLETVMDCTDAACRFHGYRTLTEEQRYRFTRRRPTLHELPYGAIEE